MVPPCGFEPLGPFGLFGLRPWLAWVALLGVLGEAPPLEVSIAGVTPESTNGQFNIETYSFLGTRIIKKNYSNLLAVRTQKIRQQFEYSTMIHSST